ncbi:MAG TPA: D-arabinono-1,4-lactone oxidase, partial [Myxococcota bacterium]|nr:D-arabinono-1,4-lactone oxidase [Myxococcota bacterium]
YEAMVPLSIRFLSGTDKTLMGMNSGRDVVSFELLTSTATDGKGGVLRPDVLAAQVAFERVMAEMGARPHWGKEYDVSPKDRFDAGVWQRFADEAKRVGAKFKNAWSAAFTP